MMPVECSYDGDDILLLNCSRLQPPPLARTPMGTLEVIGSKRSYALNWCKPKCRTMMMMN